MTGEPTFAIGWYLEGGTRYLFISPQNDVLFVPRLEQARQFSREEANEVLLALFNASKWHLFHSDEAPRLLRMWRPSAEHDWSVIEERGHIDMRKGNRNAQG